MYSRVIVEPPVEPVTLAEIKIDRAVDHSLHDDMLTALIQAAREYVERTCQMSIVTQTRETAYDSFADGILIPFGPVQSIVSLEYIATGIVSTPITDYQADIYSPIARLTPAYGSVWPTDLGADYNAVVVRYIAGYTPVAGSPTDYRTSVPSSIKTAIKLLVGNWYENREASVTGTINTALELGVKALLLPYKISLGMA